ncbi:MAG: glycosyltransferase [Chloroflexi bacterium]|nr:glycosyltransferase [Chloroflexota bacterium]
MAETQERERLKVLFVPAWYPSEVSPVSGVFVREHAKAASLHNDVVVVYTYHDPYARVAGLYQVSEAMEDGIRTIRVKHGSLSARADFAFSRLIRHWSTFSYLRRFVESEFKPDIIHAHVYSAAVPAVIVGRLSGVPVIVTEHWTNFIERQLTWERRLAARFALNRARAVLPVSEILRQNLEAYGIRNDFRVVPNTVNTDLFLPTQAKDKRKGKKRLLLVAIFQPRKGIPYLLQALRLVKEKRDDFTLDIVGDGPHREDYERLTVELGLQEYVTFHGRQPEIYSFMRNCDFYVLPSLSENFGVVLIEAMASGKPVIATACGGPQEIVNENVGILVPPKDANALSEAIDSMLDNYTNYSPEEIANYARERFSYEAVGKMLDEIYHEVARVDKI